MENLLKIQEISAVKTNINGKTFKTVKFLTGGSGVVGGRFVVKPTKTCTSNVYSSNDIYEHLEMLKKNDIPVEGIMVKFETLPYMYEGEMRSSKTIAVLGDTSAPDFHLTVEKQIAFEKGQSVENLVVAVPENKQEANIFA